MGWLVDAFRAGYPVTGVTAVFMLAGLAWNRTLGPRTRDPGETLLNIFIFLSGYGLQIFMINHIQDFTLALIGRASLYQVPESAMTFALAYVAVDFVYYWRHRAEHAVPLLWAEHCVHHSSRELNLSTAGRLPWIMIAFGWVAYIPLVVIGFAPEQLVACWSLNMIFQFTAHIDGVGRLPWVDSWLSTPSNHRVHHGENSIYFHRNFGATLILWDKIFGTYAPEGEPVRIGGRLPDFGYNPIKVNFTPMWRYLTAGNLKFDGSLPPAAAETADPTFHPAKLLPPR